MVWMLGSVIMLLPSDQGVPDLTPSSTMGFFSSGELFCVITDCVFQCFTVLCPFCILCYLEGGLCTQLTTDEERLSSSVHFLIPWHWKKWYYRNLKNYYYYYYYYPHHHHLWARNQHIVGCVFQVAVRAAFLGLVFTVGLFLSSIAPSSWHVLGWYMCFMSFFHYSEYLTIALTNPKTLSIDSFILSHSVEYAVAAVSSWMEFLVEHCFFPGNWMTRSY